ncbi:MAG: GNAT family N-acetyltransferase [Enterobacterales bacterium]|nr:GNAT family N-acetyltransferase [Enterobacterales bacterium]
MRPFLIRPASLSDAAAISQLILSLVKEFISHEYSQEGERVMLNSMSQSAIENNISRGYEYFVAQESSQSAQIIGVLAIKNKNHIYHCFVDKKYHRQHIAKQLWQYYLGLENMPHCSVNSSKYAIGFYQSIGFKATDEVYEKQGVTCYPMVRDSNDS